MWINGKCHLTQIHVKYVICITSFRSNKRRSLGNKVKTFKLLRDGSPSVGSSLQTVSKDLKFYGSQEDFWETRVEGIQVQVRIYTTTCGLK